MNYENKKTKQHTKPKWFHDLITLVISFVMIVGIFGWMQLEAKAVSITIDVGNSDSVEIFKKTTFKPEDTLIIYDSKGIIKNGNCYSSDGYDGSKFTTITWGNGENNKGTLNFSDLQKMITNPQINNPQWQISSITYNYNTANTIRIDFKLVNNSSSVPSDTPSSETGSEAAPSAPSHECNFQWVTTVEPQPGVDGLEEYKCVTCGSVKESRSIPANMATVKNLYGFIKDAPENGTVTTDFGNLHTISDYLLKKMAERSDATVTIQFEYKNQKLQITFPAGTDYTPILNDTDTMYGFYGVAAKLGLTVTERQ